MADLSAELYGSPQNQQAKFDLAKDLYGDQQPETSMMQDIGQGAGDLAAGMIRGAGSIGATLLAPWDMGKDFAAGKGLSLDSNRERRAEMDFGLRELGANPDSAMYATGKLGSEIAGTAGIGGVLAKGVMGAGSVIPQLAPYAPKIAAALESGGFRLNPSSFVGPAQKATLATKAGDMATRMVGGGASAAAMAGMVDPSNTGTGAAIGAALPPTVKAAGAAGTAFAGKVSPAVIDLYQKAQKLGIDIPLDRIANSRPMNAMAASLNYLPFSGRAKTEARMLSQMNRAVSRTFGQDSDNVTMALRSAGKELGQKFDDVLSNNTVRVDQQFTDDLLNHLHTAESELETGGAQIIKNKIMEIANKSMNNQIDGQAAYNIKKSLDRIGNRNSPEAFYARELKKSLMGALNRSLPGDKAQSFAKVRQQYGNMMELENLAQNGAEGGISVGRLANLKHINNPDLQDLADIAAQFVKTREAPHGAMQRVLVGGVGGVTAAATGTAPLIAGALAAGRAANMGLNSGTLKDLLMQRGMDSGRLMDLLANPATRALPAAISANP